MKKIVQVENIELGEWKLLQMTLYSDDTVNVHVMKDIGENEPQVNVDLDIPKRLFFQAVLRLIEEDNR